ncbi:MAG: alkaline phosphatase family protein [Ilumatobacteraceae bacterium]
MTSAAGPIAPDYSGPNVRGIVPALLAPRSAPPPSWLDSELVAAPQVVVLVLDGLGWWQLDERRSVAPTLASMRGGPITTVAPSTTATALTSITTGLTPGEHGLVGYRMDIGGGVMNVLRWYHPTGDARRTVDPARTQPFRPFLGESVPVVSRADLEGTAFTAAHLRGTRPHGWRTMSGLPVTVAQLIGSGERFVYAYYDGIDKVAHASGFGEHYDAELAAADRLVADLLERLPGGTGVVVIADHGQVHVGANTLPPHPDVLRLTRYQSGEGRFRWLHARPGAADDLLEAARSHHADVAWVRSRAEVLDAGWFGPLVSPPVASRLGDVALVTSAPVSFDDPDDTGSTPLVCRHGSLTPAEMHVPLLTAVC